MTILESLHKIAQKSNKTFERDLKNLQNEIFKQTGISGCVMYMPGEGFVFDPDCIENILLVPIDFIIKRLKNQQPVTIEILENYVEYL